ncbi:MAG TPA: Fic/DOC family N-terminal domain-containing protein [Balneolales bacterium]|nr:Fic/DOC family N-terminal domain-containing protein [Balneolales bacterium]
MSFYQEVPYNDLPLLPPDQAIESASVLKSAITANRTLAELKGRADIIPNQSILINSIILQEARASSEIENIITTNDRLFEAFTAADQDYDPHTKEVLRYREALWMGYRKLRDHSLLTANLFIDIVQTIKQNQDAVRKDSGTVIANPGTKQIIYTPPEGEPVIRELLSNLEKFINDDSDGLDPLVKMAVIHYQFEAIHPFSDGNGRTGRIINILYLVQKELLTLPILYLSDYIINHKSEYYRKIREVTEKGAWEPWILFVLDAIRMTADETMQKIESIKELLARTIEEAREKLPARVYSKELIELLFEQPYCKVRLLVDKGIAKRQTAAEYLKELENIGILRSKQVGRENLYLNVPLYGLLSGEK